ncbi:MAG TPA: hypothetical protein VLY24_23620 [Bryobacteraceae bacterium]|nr:hypothetical protein [Bryobacteraceae bacterium]
MRIQFRRPMTAMLLSLLLTGLVAGQEKAPKAPTGPAPRLANGKPDFSGVWQSPRMADVTQDMACCKGVKELPFTAWGKQQWDSYDAEKGDYTGSCLPFGLLRSVGGPHPIQIIQNDKYIAMLYEQNSWFHVTPIDGRPHPKDPDATWFGNSVGHWEGDTLVIDTIAFNGKTKVDTIGHPVSDQLHTVERFKRRDLGHIDYVLTIDDPKTYTKPWDSVRTWTLRPDWEIMEYSCEENNKDLQEGHIKPGLNPEGK